MRIESRWGLPQKPKLESLNLGTMKIRIDTPNFQPGQPATIFSAVRRKLRGGCEIGNALPRHIDRGRYTSGGGVWPSFNLKRAPS